MVLWVSWVVLELHVASAGVSHVDTVGWQLDWAERPNRASHVPGVLVLAVGMAALGLCFLTFLPG